MTVIRGAATREMNRRRRVSDDGVIQLTRGKFTVIDVENVELARQYSWHYVSSGYAATRRGQYGEFIYLHRLILDAAPKEYVDHINHDTLDNRRSNLRICTNAENTRNGRPHKDGKYSLYKGVTRDPSSGLWLAQLMVNGKQISKSFKTEREAAIHYNKLALEHHGPFAFLNEIQEADYALI